MEIVEYQRVKHKSFGEGFVIDQRHTGHEYLIRFSSTVRLWLKKSSLTFLPTAEEIKAKKAALLAETTLIDEQALLTKSPLNNTAALPHKAAIQGPHKAKPAKQKQPKPLPYTKPQKVLSPISAQKERTVIEAFRLGIVPSSSIMEWTLGRSKEIETVHKWLKDESSGTLILRGEYGSGKSHLIEYLHASGFELNYAVSLVGINPCDAQPGFPKRVYRHLIRNLKIP